MLFLADISRIQESNVLFHVTVLQICIFVFLELCIDLQNDNCLRVFVMAIFSSNKCIWMICKWEKALPWYLNPLNLQSLRPISQYLSLFQNSSCSEQKSTVCGLNCGSFSTALAQNTFNGYIFPFI